MSLIDGVIEAGSSVGVQCLQWVNNVTHGGGSGYYDAGGLALSAKGKGILQTAPSLGDIAVWAPNSGGAGGSGHAALVTGLGSGGTVAVTGTNWPSGAGATQYWVGGQDKPYGMSAPSGYIHPSDVGGHNILNSNTPTVQAPADSSGNLPTGTGPGWSIGPWQVFSGAGLNRVLLTLAGVALVGVGLLVIFRKDIPAVVSKAVPV